MTTDTARVTETSCNTCGCCCSPVVVTAEYYFYAIQWADEPLPEDAPEGYYANKGRDISDPAVVSKIREHILNGRHFTEHFNPVLMTQSGVALECEWFDKVNRLCTNHEERPPVCRGYPWYQGTRKLKDVGDVKGILPPLCSYWADVEPERRPSEWVHIDTPTMRAKIEAGEVNYDWQGTRAVAQSLNK